MKVDVDIRKVMALLGSAEEDIREAVATGIKQGIDELELDVKANAPRAGDMTPNMNGGGKKVDYNIGAYTYKTFSGDGQAAEMGITGEASDLAAFIEFGTGRDAAGYVPTLESDFQRQAMEHYKNGKGTLVHVPFFIPAWIRGKDRIVTLVQEKLNNLTPR